jgi:small-conductance mechanosensitive channel
MPFDFVPLAALADWFDSDRLSRAQWREFGRAAALAAAVIIAAVAGYAVTVRGINLAERRGRLPKAIAFAVRKVLRWITFLVAATLLLQVLNVSQSVFAALAGVLTLVAAGFVAFWSVLSNILCAIILLIARPFMIGDRLTFPGDNNLTGEVSDFNLLFTTLLTDDGKLLQVPNSLFFQKLFLREHGARPKELAASLEAPKKPAADSTGK